jgi:hypothetical protein
MYIKMIVELKKREAETGERIYVERDWRKKKFQFFFKFLNYVSF